MKFFNFFRGIIPDPIELLFVPAVIRDEYNGVTNPYLIEIYNEFKTYRDWIIHISLIIINKIFYLYLDISFCISFITLLSNTLA